MYKIIEESTTEAMHECLALGEAYYNEVESKHDRKPWNPDTSLVQVALDTGLLKIITARNGKNLIAYTCFIISKDFMTSETTAKEVALYIDPTYRGGSLFIRLMQKWEDICVSLGVGTLILGFKHGHNSSLPERIGYEATETIYQKLL